MDDPQSSAALGIAAAILAGAFINGITAAVDALGPARLRALAEGEGALARIAARVLSRADAIRDRRSLARVACVAAAASLAATSFTGVRGIRAEAVAVLVVAFLYAVAAQFATSIARRRPTVFSLHVLRFMRPFEYVMAPFTWPLALVRTAVDRLLPLSTAAVANERIMEIALEQALEAGEAAGGVNEARAELLWNVLEFNHTIAREIMIPRTKVVGFEIDTPINEIIDVLVESQHSRYPVYRGSLDHVEGVLFAKDLFRAIRDRGDETVRLADILRKPVFYIQQNQKIGDVLRTMQVARIHLAVVTDDFGGTSGIVTLEDIVEEIVGEIQDEHDEEEPPVREVEPGRYVANAQILVDDLVDFLGEQIPHDEGDFDRQVVSSSISPDGSLEIGEVLDAEPFELRVLDADPRSVRKVEISAPRRPAEPKPAPG